MTGHLSPHDLIRIGTVTEVDLGAGTVRVEIGEEEQGLIESHDLPWATLRAGKTRIWSPPSIGEQVIIVSPDGVLESGFVFGALFSDDNPEPGDSVRELILFEDGAELAYDPESHQLEITLPEGGQVTITAPTHVTINADNGVTINGDVQVNGTLTASEDVIGGGIHLKTHKHSGVQAGGAQSGAPV